MYLQGIRDFLAQLDLAVYGADFCDVFAYEYTVQKQDKGLFKVDWTFELLYDPLLTISPNLLF